VGLKYAKSALAAGPRPQSPLLVARETVVEQDEVKALNCNRYALEKKAGLSVVL